MATDKTTMLAEIAKINAVDGFDPTPFAVDFTDLSSGEVRKRLPVMIQMAWFRMKYPEGKITVQTEPGHDCFVATARVYPSYKDPIDCYLAEASASRGEAPDKPSVSPREWAQTAAIGIALRNAGFGLQFAMAGEDFESIAPKELEDTSETTSAAPAAEVYEVTPAKPEPTEEELRQSVRDCIDKYGPGGNVGIMSMIMYADPQKMVSTMMTLSDEAIRYGTNYYCK